MLNFYFIVSQNYLHIMRTFLNYIKNETLDEIKTSLENLWQQMIQLSEFFQYSFELILKRKCLVRASRVRSGESGTPSTIIYTRWSSRRYELGCDTPVVPANVWKTIEANPMRIDNMTAKNKPISTAWFEHTALGYGTHGTQKTGKLANPYLNDLFHTSSMEILFRHHSATKKFFNDQLIREWNIWK